MVEFKVDKTKLEKQCRELEELETKIKKTVVKIEEIKSSLVGISMPNIALALGGLSIKLEVKSRKIKILAEVGIQICMRYEETDTVIAENSSFIDKIIQFFDDLIITPQERKEISDNIEELLEKYKYTDVQGVERIDTASMSNDEKDELIELYEKIHRGYARDMNHCLQSLEDEGLDDDIRNIKAIAYTAPEPYRTIYLENVRDINIIDLHYNGTQNYSSKDGGISFNVDQWNGKYDTFFHESAHAIDDLLVKGAGNGSLTSTYTDENDRRLTDALQSDVRDAIADSTRQHLTKYDLTTLEEAVICNQIENAIMNCHDADNYTPSLTDVSLLGKDIMTQSDMEKLYETVYKDVKNDNSCVSSDIYGGYTGNLLRNGNGHNVIRSSGGYYWIEGEGNADEGTLKPVYENGNVKYNNLQASEFFAENFSAQVTGNVDDLNGMNGRFDNGIPYIEAMVESLYD